MDDQAPAGIILKLRLGDIGKVMAGVALLVPCCVNCGYICEIGSFASRQDHLRCAARVDLVVKKGELTQVPRPKWVAYTKEHIGADGYYVCTACGAFWMLVEPEQHDNGTWERLA